MRLWARSPSHPARPLVPRRVLVPWRRRLQGGPDAVWWRAVAPGLALLGIQPSNLLLLDEPTNHLDIPAREAIETFMRESPATLLVVSHDRRLLETVCDRLWVVDDGLAVPFDGGYRAWRASVADGWTVASPRHTTERCGLARSSAAPFAGASGRSARADASPGLPSVVVPPRRGRTSRRSKLSKDAYRRPEDGT